MIRHLLPGATSKEIRDTYAETRASDFIIVHPTHEEETTMPEEKKKRSHGNTSRLRSEERARAFVRWFIKELPLVNPLVAERRLTEAFQAHARQALRRDDRRDRK